jgi:hypothetical protein
VRNRVIDGLQPGQQLRPFRLRQLPHATRHQLRLAANRRQMGLDAMLERSEGR